MNMRILTALLVLLALQFVPGVGVGDAQAINYYSYQSQAWAACNNQRLNHSSYSGGANYHCGIYQTPPPPYIASIYILRNSNNSFVNVGSNEGWAWRYAGCPNGASWDVETETCNPTQAECLARDLMGEGGTANLTLSAHRCKDRCNYDYIGETQELDTGLGVIKVGVQGKWKANGAECAAGDMDMELEDENPPPVSCTPTDDGQTLCVKATGEQCYSAGEGRQICWRPGETGEKVDGPILQKRVGGVVVGEPGKTPPYGAMYEPAAAGVEVMAKYGGFREGGSPSAPSVPKAETQITTTTQNFSTTTNVNAGGNEPDQGENADGTPGATPGNQGPGGEDGGAGGDANGNGQPDWTEGDAPGVPGEGESDPGDAPGPPSSVGVGTDLLDMGGLIGGPGTCPELGVLDFGQFGEFDMSSEPAWCQLVSIMRAIVLLMAAFTATKILMGLD